MRIAIIDLGTNSVRFDVHQLGAGGRLKQLHREKLMVRLGQGVFTQGKLDPAAMGRTLEAFRSFQESLEQFRVKKVVAFGTSALREASDGEVLLQKIQETTGIQVRVISGQEEARLIARGILEGEKKGVHSRGRTALIDIGGGSTEFNFVEKRKILHSDSFPLGTARLQQVFLQSRRIGDPEPIQKLRRHIRSVLLPKLIGEEWGKAPFVVGSSGTIRALAKMLRKQAKGNPSKFSKAQLSKLVEQMSRMSTLELLELPGMEPKRVDMILAGAILFEECLSAVGAREFKTTEFSLRDGILAEERELSEHTETPQLSLHLEEIRERVLRAGAQEQHFEQVRMLSLKLFDKLQGLHRLDRRFRAHLEAAAILHDVGEAISPSNHEKHSHYFVQNADFSGMQAWETKMIADLCLHHRTGNGPSATGRKKKQPRKKANSKYAGDELQSLVAEAFLPLLAILRLADALDRGHRAYAQITSIRVTSNTVTLTLTTRESVDLELLRVEQKKELFEKVFGRRLIVKARNSSS